MVSFHSSLFIGWLVGWFLYIGWFSFHWLVLISSPWSLTSRSVTYKPQPNAASYNKNPHRRPASQKTQKPQREILWREKEGGRGAAGAHQQNPEITIGKDCEDRQKVMEHMERLEFIRILHRQTRTRTPNPLLYKILLAIMCCIIRYPLKICLFKIYLL